MNGEFEHACTCKSFRASQNTTPHQRRALPRGTLYDRGSFESRDDLDEAEAIHGGAFVRPASQRRSKCFVDGTPVGLVGKCWEIHRY